MFSQPNYNSKIIKNLQEGEQIGVFDLHFTSSGWVHGNCLQSLPLPRKFND